MGKIFELTHTVDWIGLGPIDLDTDRTSDFLSCKDFRRARATLFTAVGTTGDDWNWTFRQATVAGAGDAKDLVIVSEYWIKQAATNLLSVATWTRNTQTEAALVSGDATSAEQVSMCQVDLDFSKLDVAGGFDFIGCLVTLDASGGSQQGLVTIDFYDPRYAGDAPVSVLT